MRKNVCRYLGHACGCVAGVCALLALLLVPDVARPNSPGDPTDCTLYCESLGEGGMGSPCYNNCMAVGQCPNKFSGGVFVGCLNPGAACYNNGNALTCVVPSGYTQCTCGY
jgi:hypothetical protein